MKNAQRPTRPGVHRKERWPVGNHLNPSIHLCIAVLLALAWCMNPSPSILGKSTANQPPVAVAGNLTIVEPGEEVFFHAHDSHDPDGEITLYEWDFDGDGEYEWQSHDNGTTTHAYDEERAYSATLRVTDNGNASSTDVYHVLVQYSDDDKDDSDVKTLLYIVGIAEILFGVFFIGMVWWWRRNLYSG